MYQLISYICAYTTLLPDLPVEVWCHILRLLDPASLLVTVRTVSYLNFVVQGDPVLKKILREAIDEENKNRLKMLTQPKMAVQISRQDYSRLFGSNVQKYVKSTGKLPTLRQPKDDSTGKSLYDRKKYSQKRYNPYRL